MSDQVQRACGHGEAFPPPARPEFLEKKLLRFRARFCGVCSAAREAERAEAGRAAAAEARRQKQEANLAARREEVYGCVPAHLRDARLTYLQIANLSASEASGLAALHLLDAEDLASKSAKHLAGMKARSGWDILGKALDKLAAGGAWFRMGHEPRKGDWFASVYHNGGWLGMRGHALTLCVCKLLLMVHFEAWPSTARRVEGVRT